MKQIMIFFACLFMTSTSFLSADCSKCESKCANCNCNQNTNRDCSSKNDAVSHCSHEDSKHAEEAHTHSHVADNTEKTSE